MNFTKTPHFITSIQNSRAEMFTTDLGLAAYNGQRERILQALNKGINWSAERPYLLTSAIFGQQWQIAKDLIKGGMPISDDTYIEIYNYGDHSLLDLLPSRPDLLTPLNDNVQKQKFTLAIIDDDLDEMKKLYQSQWLEAETDILGDRVLRRPLHYAAKNCNLNALHFLLLAGAHVNALTGDFQSALTLVSRCPSVEKIRRKKCFHLLRKHNAEMIPGVNGWLQNWWLSCGAWRSD